MLDGTLTVTLILTLFETNVNSGPAYETFALILKPYTCTYCTQTENHFTSTNFKNKGKLEERQGAVYTIKCCDCQTTYIGETGRNLSTRLTEHNQTSDEKSSDLNNHISEHHLQTKHQIEYDSATCIRYSTDYYQRLTLDSWFTNLEQTPLNRSQQLPTPYKRLIN